MSDKEIGDGSTAGTVARLNAGSDKKIPNAPRQIVAVDTALLTIDVDKRQLLVVESQRTDTGKWVLPGTFVYGTETLSDAVQRCLNDKLNVRDVHPQRLDVLDAPDRDDRDRVISVAHVAVVRPEQLESLDQGQYPTRLMPVDRPGELMWDHPDIVRLAKQQVRSRYEDDPDPDGLLGRYFTLPELQQVHEAVAGEPLDRYRFRRKMENRVIGTDGHRAPAGNLGRPAQLFRRSRSARIRPDQGTKGD